MDELAELHRFNAWANASLVAGLRQLTADQLTEQRDGMYNTILGVLWHVAQVQHVYLRLIRSQGRDRLPEDLTLDQIEQVLTESAAGLVEEAQTRSPDAPVHIPWFEREVSAAGCLRQVLTHSINHRADINGWLPRFGVESTDQDYVDMVLAEV